MAWGVFMALLHFLRENGIYSSIEELFSRPLLWDLNKSHFLDLGSGSSFSDNHEYLSIVQLATYDDKIFIKFRANRQYRKILEHVTKSLGSLYLSELEPLTRSREFFAKLMLCDTTGSPIRYRFKKVGKLSPTTIRYVFFHEKLSLLFGALSGFKILEIGGGFGGQAAVSTTLDPSIEWVIYDLPEVLALEQRFLSTVNPRASIDYRSGLDIPATEGHLLLSNFALSEISRELQIVYLNRVVLNCPRGFMAWNTISEKLNRGLSISEVLEIIPGSRALPEEPLSSPGNKFIVWGEKK